MHALTIILNLQTSSQLLDCHLSSELLQITQQRDYLPNQFLSTHRQNEMHIANFQLSKTFD